MPTVPTLTANVGLGVGRPRVAPDAISLEAAGGGEYGLGRNLERLGEVLSATAIEQQAKINQANVMRATADLTLQFNENMRAQYQKFGLNALGKPATDKSEAVPSASEDFSTFAHTSLQNAMGSMDNDLQRQKLQEWYNDNFPSYLNKVATHQNNQYNEYLTESLNTQQKANMDTFVGMVKLGDYRGAEHAFNNADQSLQTYLTWQGADDKTRKKATRDLLYSNAESTVKALLDDDRAQEAYAFVNHFANRLTPNQVESLRMAIRPAAVKVQADDLATQIFNDPAMRGPDGSIDMAKVRAKAQQLATSTKTVGGQYNSQWLNVAAEEADKYGIPRNVVFGIMARETGDDDINAIQMINSQDGGNGLMQIMSYSASDYGVDKQYPNWATDPEQNIRAGVAILAQKIKDMGGDLWAGVKAYNGSGPAADAYVEQIRKNADSINVQMTGGQQVTQRNDVMYNEILAQVDILAKQEKLNYSARVNAAADAMAQASQSGQIQTLEDAQRIGTQVAGTYGIKPSDVMGVINIGTSAVGLQNRITAEQQADDYNAALEALLNGDVSTENELRVRYPNLTAAQRQQLVNSCIAPKYKWANDQTKTMVDGTIERAGFSTSKDKLQKAAVYQYVNDKVKLYVDKNGHSPSIWEIQDFAIEATHNAALVSYQDEGRFYDSTEQTSMTNAQWAGLNLHPRSVNGETRYYDDKGQEWRYNPVFERMEKVQP